MPAYVKFPEIKVLVLVEDENQSTLSKQVRASVASDEIVRLAEPLIEYWLNLGHLSRVDVLDGDVPGGLLETGDGWASVRIRQWSDVQADDDDGPQIF